MQTYLYQMRRPIRLLPRGRPTRLLRLPSVLRRRIALPAAEPRLPGGDSVSGSQRTCRSSKRCSPARCSTSCIIGFFAGNAAFTLATMSGCYIRRQLLRRQVGAARVGVLAADVGRRVQGAVPADDAALLLGEDTSTASARCRTTWPWRAAPARLVSWTERPQRAWRRARELPASARSRSPRADVGCSRLAPMAAATPMTAAGGASAARSARRCAAPRSWPRAPPREDWPTFLHDGARSGASSETILNAPTRRR